MFERIKEGSNKSKNDAFIAYSKTWQEANDVLKAFVAKLSSTELDWVWQDLPRDVKTEKHVDDVVNVSMAAWDNSAAKYVKGDVSGGDVAAAEMRDTFKAFDKTIDDRSQMLGGPPREERR
jgi:hypothetical protein